MLDGAKPCRHLGDAGEGEEVTAFLLSDRERELLVEAIETHLDVDNFLTGESAGILYDLKDRLEEAQSQQESLSPGNLPTQSQ